MALNIVIHGAGGRMGREAARAALEDRGIAVVGCLEDRRHAAVGKDIGLLCGRDGAGVAVSAELPAATLAGAVTIDFSVPAAVMSLLKTLPPGSRGLVIGTTGLSDGERERVAATARTMPVLVSPNMSLGVNLLYRLAGIAAKRLGRGYDVEIVEAHHRHKRDAPSGTARRLGEVVAGALGLEYATAAVHGREGIRGERTATEIGMHALRGGDIVGDHLVMFAGDGERLELRHIAHSRAGLARGAITAAKWLAGRKPGLYSMDDVLGTTPGGADA